MTRPVVAAFDFDGTITRRDTLLPFLARAAGPGRTGRALLVESLTITRALVGAGSRHDAKEGLLGRLLAGHELAALEAAAEEYATVLLDRAVRPWARERLAWHLERGHEVLIVTASPEVYVRPVAHRLGVETVLGTRLEVGPEGRLTGRILGANCRGPEKAARVRSWLAGREVELHAYGDSAGDRELLAMADVGLLIGRRPASRSG